MVTNSYVLSGDDIWVELLLVWKPMMRGCEGFEATHQGDAAVFVFLFIPFHGL